VLTVKAYYVITNDTLVHPKQRESNKRFGTFHLQFFPLTLFIQDSLKGILVVRYL